MSNVGDRITQLERRIATLENVIRKLIHERASDPLVPTQKVAAGYSAAHRTEPSQSETSASHAATSHSEIPTYAMRPTSESSSSISATTVLGLGGVAALVLSASYLIRLAIDTGWLTPMRQVSAAGIFGVALIAAGISFGNRIGKYAALLPAGGVVVLYLTVYGAHIIHRLVDGPAAVVGVATVSLAALAIRNHYGNNMYLLFAVVGSYAAPMLLDTLTARTTDLILYFAVWDILFCVVAWQQKQRAVYLIAAYMAFAMFDLTWRTIDSPDWMEIAQFHAFQFLIFAIATIAHSYRTRASLTINEAYAHMPPLLFFYIMECSILYRHIPDSVPYLAIASTLPLIGGFAAARSKLASGRPGELLVSAYCALVFFHAVYLEITPADLKPLGGTAIAVLLALAAMRSPSAVERYWPAALSAALIMLITIVALATGISSAPIVAPEILTLINVALLYAAYLNLNGERLLGIEPRVILYAGHLLAMAGAAQYADSRIVVSLIWASLAVGTLMMAIRRRDSVLGQSALYVFATSSVKVLLWDLSGTGPLAKVATLFVLGVSLYAGGLLYRKISERESVVGSR